MSYKVGFFTRKDVTRKTAKARYSGLTDERLREIGVRGIQNMNPAALSPAMAATGNKRPDVMVIGEFPTLADDERGEPFAGPTARILRGAIPSGFRVRYTNIVRTYPPLRKGKPLPTHEEIEFFRRDLEDDIAESKPKAIIATGAIAAGWFSDVIKKAGIDNVRGRKFPLSLNGHKFWLHPTQPLDFIAYKLSDSKYSQIPGTEHRRYFEKDIERVFADLEDYEEPKIESPALADTLKGVLCEKDSINVIANFLNSLREEKAVTIDLETNCYRPYSDGAAILSLAIGTGERTISFPLEHRGAKWNLAQKKKLHEIIGNFLISPVPKIAHNAPFDLEWMLKFWGDPVGWECPWRDSMGAAYFLDERPSSPSRKSSETGEVTGAGISLDFCCMEELGLSLKSVETIDRKNLATTDIDLVLRYGGRDTKYTHKVYEKKKAKLRAVGSWKNYLQWCKRIPSLAKAQGVGIFVDQTINKRLREKVDGEIKIATEKLNETEAIKGFEKRHGKYVDSNKNNIILFRDMLGRKEGHTKDGKYSVGDAELAKMTDEPAARLLQDARGWRKLSTTYLERMDAKHPKTFVYPDGCCHTSFKHCALDTSRLAAVEPSLLNQPSRENAFVKEQFAAKPGNICLFSDFAGQEVRGIAIMSRDKNLINAVSAGRDFHMDWAKRILELNDKYYKAATKGMPEEKRMKFYRGEVKAKFVFAGFYGATIQSRANKLDLPLDIAKKIDGQFWEEFSGVRKWQERVIKTYREKGYIESLMGYRRHGPLGEPQAINAGIQASGADLTMHAWAKLSRYAYDNDMPWLHFPLAIHDSLEAFSIPREKRWKSIRVIAESMTDFSEFEWSTVVPMVVEVSEGNHWGEKKSIGDFTSARPIREQIEELKNAAPV